MDLLFYHHIIQFQAIVKGENIPEPGIPESFKVLIKELQSLGLDITLYNENDEELELKESIDEGIELTEDQGRPPKILFFGIQLFK